MLDRFPNGFVPRFGSTTTDGSVVLGLAGAVSDSLNWSVSGRYGRNAIDWRIDDTVNLALGAASPTGFDAGEEIHAEQGVNIDAVYRFDVLSDRPASLGFGAEWRRDSYELAAGEPS